jgi:ribosomal protein L37E
MNEPNINLEYCHRCKTQTTYYYTKRTKFCSVCGLVIPKNYRRFLSLKQFILLVVMTILTLYGLVHLVLEVLSWIGILK